MKKNNIYLIVGGLAVVGIALLILRKRKPKDVLAEVPAPVTPIDVAEPVITPAVNAATSGIAAATRFLTTYQDYTIQTQRTGLNVRQKPDGNAKVVASLPKGSTIKAKASGVKGWFEVSKDGKKPIGFVSSQFLKAK